MAKNTNPNWVSATAKYVRVAPRKARLVVDLVRNQPVARAFELLQFCDHAVAVDVEKVLKSAVANAYQNKGMRPETLQIVAAYVDEGPTLKRIRPRAKGSASRINKSEGFPHWFPPRSHRELALPLVRRQGLRHDARQ